MMRGSGVLLHVTSLPSRLGIGDLGPEAYRFADFLASAGQRYWQILPLDPTDPGADHSPYIGTSGFAQNHLLVSPEMLAADGLLDPAELDDAGEFPDGTVAFDRVVTARERLLDLAYDAFAERRDRRDFERYCAENAWWLDDYALFAAIRADLGDLPWNLWPCDLRERVPGKLREAAGRLVGPMDRVRFRQFAFDRQWRRLRHYCQCHGLRILGDMPIYMDYDSADVWIHPGFFELDADRRPAGIAGAPPDAFSAEGQLWGQPTYRWDALRRTGWRWWTARFERALAFVDGVRIDHFRGLISFWRVPAGSTSAADGAWVPGPGRELVAALARRFPCLSVFAEDLGTVDAGVRELAREFGIPGMRVLLIAFQEGFARSRNSPHHAVRNSFLYTGTHDTNTVRGWAEDDATVEQRRDLRRCFGRDIPPAGLPWEFVRLAMSSVADTVLVPVQDLLGLGSEARMNRPGTSSGNWGWRLEPDWPAGEVAERLRAVTRDFARD